MTAFFKLCSASQQTFEFIFYFFTRQDNLKIFIFILSRFVLLFDTKIIVTAHKLVFVLNAV